MTVMDVIRGTSCSDRDLRVSPLNRVLSFHRALMEFARRINETRVRNLHCSVALVRASFAYYLCARACNV